MFAPDQEWTAAELSRVCRPRGRIGMVNWTPDSYVGELFRVIGRHLPPPPGVRPPLRWGSEQGPAEHQAEFFAAFYGPARRALTTLGAGRAADLKADMLAAVRRFDVSDDDTLVLRMDYLEAVIAKPATS